jgi:hypothetical protein
MALPAGCPVSCRPQRTTIRKFTAKDAARIICYARNAGARWDEIKTEAQDRGCIEILECDCERMKNIIARYEALAAAAIALILLAIPVAGAAGLIYRAGTSLVKLKRVIEAEQKALGQAEKVERLLQDGYRTLQTEFRVLKDDPAIVPGVVIRAPR